MFRRWLIDGAVLVLLLLLGWVGVQLWQVRQLARRPADTQPAVAAAQAERRVEKGPRLAVVLLQRDWPQPTQRILVCEEQCKAEPTPGDVGTDAVWAQGGWYFYAPRGGGEAAALQRLDASNLNYETVLEETPLTRPRDFIVSPTGESLAYWLDNIAEPAERLTELWVYDVAAERTRLLAEKIFVPDVKSRPRWNGAGTRLWLVADTAVASEPDRLELVVVDAQAPAVAAKFKQINWEKDIDLAATGVMDLDARGEKVAMAKPNLAGTQLVVDGEIREVTRIPGEVAHLQWMEDGSLLYLVRDGQGVTAWRVTNGVHRFVARINGTLRAVKGDASGTILAMVMQERGRLQLKNLQATTGRVVDGPLLGSLGSDMRILTVRALAQSAGQESVSARFEDAELTAFIERHGGQIAGVPEARVQRVIVTHHTNTVYMDYAGEAGETQRILVTIRDAIHPEWSIRARYEGVGGQWQRVAGGSEADPAPARLYEWEPALEQWILKQEL